MTDEEMEEAFQKYVLERGAFNTTTPGTIWKELRVSFFAGAAWGAGEAVKVLTNG